MHACMYLRKVLFLLIRFVFRIACNVICSIHFHAVHIHIKPTCRQYNLLCSCHYMCIVEENKCQRQSYSTYNQTTTTLTKSYKSVLIDAINEYYISLNTTSYSTCRYNQEPNYETYSRFYGIPSIVHPGLDRGRLNWHILYIYIVISIISTVRFNQTRYID